MTADCCVFGLGEKPHETSGAAIDASEQINSTFFADRDFQTGIFFTALKNAGLSYHRLFSVTFVVVNYYSCSITVQQTFAVYVDPTLDCSLPNSSTNRSE